MAETMREVFQAALEDVRDCDFTIGFEQWKAEWLARFDAAESGDVFVAQRVEESTFGKVPDGFPFADGKEPQEPQG